MRQNIDGALFTFAYGNVIASHIDPVEKKPLYHFLPGTYTYSIATIGCNFRCGFCQNWTISQLSRRNDDADGYEFSATDIVKEAVRNQCESISFTYTEPTIFFEYAMDIAELSKKKGLKNIFVTNGYMSQDAISILSNLIDAANVDLKSFSEDTYKKCGGSLHPVLESIGAMKKSGIWVEITTLIVPGINDSEAELRRIAEFIYNIDPDMPWHISRFHPDFKMTKTPSTPAETLEKAYSIGREEGLRHIYIGNMQLSAGTNTICPGCANLCVVRAGFSATRSKSFSEDGRCLKCGTQIKGVWR